MQRHLQELELLQQLILSNPLGLRAKQKGQVPGSVLAYSARAHAGAQPVSFQRLLFGPRYALL